MAHRNLNQIENIFHAALNLPVADRSAYVREVCDGDETLYSEVSSLLSTVENSNGFMEESALAAGLNVMANSTEDSLLGKSLNGYRIVSLLGKGGMGEVYLAEDMKLNRKVALKFLSTEFVGDNWAKRQLIKEAQAAAMLDHPNICSVYGIEECDGHSFIVMQYVEGETVANLIRRQAIQSSQFVDLACQIVRAVAEAHAHGIIHRDLKPGNIMVTPDGQVKVLDFGLAKTVQQPGITSLADSISQLSQAGVLRGTVAYMSPEQLRGERLDFRSDVFSLGTVLFELLSGTNPYVHGNPAETISAVLTLKPSRLAQKLRNTSRDLNRIVLRCMQKDRDGRYASASELILALQETTRESNRSLQWHSIINYRNVAAIFILVIFVAVVGFIYNSLTRSYKLAVIPFTNESGDATFDHMQDGFTESLISRLAKLPGVRVNSFSTVKFYRGRASGVEQIGRDLAVDAVLVGKIVKQGDSVVLQTQLMNLDKSETWNETHDLNPVAVSDLKNNLVTEIVSKLNLNIGSIPGRDTNNNEAFLEFLRGKHYWNNRSKENIVKAIERYKAAINLDPAYAAPHAGLADCYVLMNSPAYGGRPTNEVIPMAKAEAQKALEIDSYLPEALTSLGVINLKYDWDWHEAEKQFRRAVEIRPDYAPAHYWLATLLTITGRQAEAMSESTLAKNFDPTSSSMRSNFCRQHYYGRDYEAAATCLNELLKENPDDFSARHFLGFVNIRRGHLAEAIEIFKNLPDSNKEGKLPPLGYALAQNGQLTEAQKILEEVSEMQKKNLVPPIEMAVIYLGMGNTEEVFYWLEKAYSDRSALMIYLTAEPAFDSIRSDPRFINLAARLKLPVPETLAIAQSK
jgi:serine/threonine-protein kinase